MRKADGLIGWTLPAGSSRCDRRIRPMWTRRLLGLLGGMSACAAPSAGGSRPMRGTDRHQRYDYQRATVYRDLDASGSSPGESDRPDARAGPSRRVLLGARRRRESRYRQADRDELPERRARVWACHGQRRPEGQSYGECLCLELRPRRERPADDHAAGRSADHAPFRRR